MSSKRKIVWVTPDAFVDCDFNPQILTAILKVYEIHWIVILSSKGSRFKESDFNALNQLSGLSIEFLYTECRERNPKMLVFFQKLYTKIQKSKPDIVYFNYIPTSPYILPIYWRLNKKKTIFTAHDGSVKPTFKMPWISKVVFDLAFRTIKYVNMFSESQAKLFSDSFPKVKQYLIPLALKDFGKSKLSKRTDFISFFFFGSIHPGKNVGLLIDAACSLYEDGVRGFRISINGMCSDWSIYQQRIKYPELFELNIRMIENAEIPDLFAQNHYMVFPYKEMSQSGALKVAFNYNVPVIVSNLEGFKDEVKAGINGYVFDNEDINSLKNILSNCILNHDENYSILCSNMKEFIQENYSVVSISKKYLEMFDTYNE